MNYEKTTIYCTFWKIEVDINYCEKVCNYVYCEAYSNIDLLEEEDE
jgi:hypothetical protein